MTIIYCLSIYAATFFTPSHYFRSSTGHFNAILEFIGTVTVGYVIIAILLDFIINRLEKLIKNGRLSAAQKKVQLKKLHFGSEVFRSGAIVLIISIMIYLDYIIFRDLFEELMEMLINAGWIYLSFTFIFSIVVFRLLKRLEVTQPGFGYTGAMILGSGVLGLIYFLSVVTYAYTIFPYIASVKGGADYTGAPRASITLRPHIGEVHKDPFVTDVVIVYTTSSVVYVASYKGPNNPCKWRARSSTPVITGLMRAEIQSITSSAAPPGALHPNCDVP
jgi:hypothetical protein